MGIKKFLGLILLTFVAVTITACNSVASDIATGDNVGSFGTYDNLKEYLLNFYDENNGNYYLDGRIEMVAGEINDALDTPSADYSEEKTQRDYSKTNNQVAGVDESDRILTDGYKIYIVSGNQFFIIDADTLSIDFQYQFLEVNSNPNSYGYLDSMYLYDGKIVLTSYVYTYEVVKRDDCTISTNTSTETFNNPDAGESTVITDGQKSDEYYYNDCNDYNYSYGTKIVVLDVSDTTDVTVSRELYFDSSYLVDSRMIDGELYMILNNYMIQYGFQDELYIPRYMDSVIGDELINLPANRIFFLPNDGESFGYLMLASFNVSNDKDVNVKAYLGSTYQIYMSLNNLYTVINKWVYNETIDRYDYFTYIVRFAIENNELSFKALGKVDGSPLNQFSMDEYNGVFRIATTGYSYSDNEEWKITNSVYLLDATKDNEMSQISVLEGLGKPGERIFSVRFSEETAFVTTFVQTDPLYKLDLSNPENPVISGELYEDGVSDYLHEITDNLMIGVGRQAENVDGWTRFTGVKVSLYDTSGDTPLNLETYLVQGEYSYTNVMWDHKAFVYFTPKDADFTYVAIPVYEYYEDYWGYSQSLYVFKVTHEGELKLVARLSHMVKDADGKYPYYDSIEKAVIIEHYIYTVSYSEIKFFDMNDGFKLVNSQELNTDYYSIWGYPELVDGDAVGTE